MRWIYTFLAVGMVLTIPSTVKAAESTLDPVLLTLDEGFVGRPVSLDLFAGMVNVSWDAKAFIAPSDLMVSLGTGVTSTNEQAIAAPAVTVSFSNAAAVNKKGTFRITVKAHRPPSSTEASETNVMIAGSASTTIIQGSFKGDRVSYAVPAVAALTISPAFREGIMREGMASWYAYKKCLCAASPDVPKGTRMIVRRADNPSRFTVVTINDWGPERDKHPERVIDLDKVAFARIGNPRGGVMAVTVEVLEPEDPLWKLGDELPPPNWKKLLAALQKK